MTPRSRGGGKSGNPAAVAGFPSAGGKSRLGTFPRSGVFHGPFTHKLSYRAVFLGWLIYSISNVPFSTLSFRRKHLPPLEEEPAGTWHEWAQQARAAAARGDYRDAVRIIYGAAVRRLAEAGTWQVDPARTHREYARLLPPDSVQRPRFLAITACFELGWYGSAKASATDYEAVLAELESL